MRHFWLIAQTYNGNGNAHANPLIGACFGIVELGIVALVIAGVWKAFVKAGYPGWAAIVPFYNAYILLKIAERPGWWLILLFIPLVNFIIAILVCVDVAAKFGKGAGFGVGLALLGFIFFPILGFGDAVYQPQAAGRGFDVVPNSPGTV